MNLGVVGSRSFDDYPLMKEVLDLFGPFTLISGGANGADSHAERYADEMGYKKIIHKPDWALHGRSAGFVRNKLIIKDSNFVIAFWDGKSRGTKSTIDLCRRLGVDVEIIPI